MPPFWLDPHGRRRPTLPCLQCGAPSPILRLTPEDLRRLGWAPFRTQRIPDWCGHSKEYVAWPEGGGWLMVVVWEPVRKPGTAVLWCLALVGGLV